MGYNATVVVMVDALGHIERDTKFGANLSRAIREHLSGSARPGRTDVRAGSHFNAAHVVEIHHADSTAVVTVGGNLGVQQLCSHGWKHHEREEQEKLLRKWAANLGFDLVPKAEAPAATPVPAYLLVLSDHECTSVSIVSRAVWDWIHGKYESDKPFYKECVPADVLAEVKERGDSESFAGGKFRITVGSYENDRALSAPGHEFDEVVDAMKYAASHNLDIKETYHGCIY
jgi:hypothetical protein